MTPITGIAHICLASTDLEATERFYCEGLGLRKAFEFLRGGARVGYYLEAGNAQFIEVFVREAVEPADRHPLMHICLRTDDLDALRERLAAHGIEVTAKKLGADQSWQAWTRDPDGVRIEFHQYTPESSQRTGRPCRLE